MSQSIRQDSRGTEWAYPRECHVHPTWALCLYEAGSQRRLGCRLCGSYWVINEREWSWYAAESEVAEAPHVPIEPREG